MKLTLHTYIFNEIWPTFFASLFVFVFIVMTSQMLPLTQLILTQGVHAVQVMLMVLYSMPDFVVFALPAVSLMAVVLAFMRLSADSEIIALKSCGISLYQMLPTVVVLSIAGLLLTALISIYAVPWGNKSFKDLIFQIAESKADLGVKERIFSEPFDSVVFYVNSFSTQERLMKDVFVVDKRDQGVVNTIIAKEGRIFSHPEEKMITLHFMNGTIFMVGKELESARTIKFNTYDLNIGLNDIMAAVASRKKKPKEMSVSELMEGLKKSQKGEAKYYNMIIQLLEKFSIPLAVFLMGIIGVPLGAQMKARGRSSAIGVSLIVFLIYYMCFAGARSICETGTITPVIGVWIPDAFLLIICIFLFWRVGKGDSIGFFPSFLWRSKVF
ncbi:MAG: LPS export ABC transporter permease LptF [Desulfobacteraceae bacterium]|nr:MAG: LPS export ABC transporter permease LptF [Desulfobacteraceae bacterium]